MVMSKTKKKRKKKSFLTKMKRRKRLFLTKTRRKKKKKVSVSILTMARRMTGVMVVPNTTISQNGANLNLNLTSSLKSCAASVVEENGMTTRKEMMKMKM